MKNIAITFFLFIVSLSVANAQDPCGTIMPQDQIDWLTEYKSNPFGSLKVSRANDFYYIPVKIHIVGDNDGNGYYKMRLLLNTMCEINSQYAPVGFYFYIYGDIHYLNNSTMYDHPNYNVSSIVSANNDAAAVNMYFVKNPAGACGYFSGGWGGGKPYIAINNDCGGIGNSTVAHELGHYFSLPHTFFGWENRNPTDAPTSSDERVNGSNCSSSGDRFCDTPADYISNRWQCPYNSTKLDFTGSPYSPDGSLYMSYANDGCQNKFSNEQTDAMIAYLNSNSRRFLLNQPEPDTAVGNAVSVLYPPDLATGIPANYVQLKWDKVPGATHYFVSGTRYSNPNSTSFEIVTRDTFLLITNLSPGFTYRWKIKPYNGANVCVPYSNEFRFSTSQPTLISPNAEVSSISCNGKNDGSIIINPIGGTEPYSYSWSTGETDVNIIYNLSAGTYFVTITDGNSSSLVLNIDILEPAPLDIQFADNGGVVTANVTGGTPPFTYSWNNGVTGTSISANSGDFYYLHITDSRGCTYAKDSNGFVNVEENETVSGVKVYPNPLTLGNMLNVEFALGKNEKVNIHVFDFAGRKVAETTEDASQGVYKKSIAMDEFAKGIYLVKIYAGNEIINKKVMIQ
jgi:hypothetical protein